MVLQYELVLLVNCPNFNLNSEDKTENGHSERLGSSTRTVKLRQIIFCVDLLRNRMSQENNEHTQIALFAGAGEGSSPRPDRVRTPGNLALQARKAAAHGAMASPVARTRSGGAGLLHRAALLQTAQNAPGTPGTPATPANASPHVQAALKEIVASPSPKVSALVERLKQKEAKHVEAVVVEKQREQKRAAMLAEAQKVREARKKAAEESEAKFKRAEDLRAEADVELAEQRERSEAARHNYNEIAAKRGGAGRSAALGESEKEDQALLQAERKQRQRVKEAELARAAMTAAHAEHDKALRMEQAFLDINQKAEPEGAPPKLEMEDRFAMLAPLSPDDASSPLSGLQVFFVKIRTRTFTHRQTHNQTHALIRMVQVLSPQSVGMTTASPCEVVAEEERLAWWAKDELETVMEAERKREEEERREKMRKLEAEESQRREEERRQREEREQQAKAAKKRALEIEMEARRQFEKQEIERQERERAEAEQRERERYEELERQVCGSVCVCVCVPLLLSL